MRLFRKAALTAALLVGSVATANAVPFTWVDDIDFNSHISAGESESYSHNILDNGFTPFVDLVYDYNLRVNLFDDGGRRDGGEWALIDVPGFTGDRVEFNVSGAEFGGWSLIGYLQLALTGTYDVTITSLLGDFYLGGSTLTVWGEELGSTNVPEPATLGLLGLGLLAAGAVARKKKV